MEKTTIKVGGMSCGHCKAAVENELKNMDGVTNASVDLQAAEVTVEFDPAKTNADAMIELINDIGYDA